MMTEKTKYEAELKKKLENFEPSGYSSHWNGIKNKLPHQGKYFWFKAAVITGVAAFVAGIILFSLPGDKKNTNANKEETSAQNNQVVNTMPDDSGQDNESSQVFTSGKPDDVTETPLSDNENANALQSENEKDTHITDNASESTPEIDNKALSNNDEVQENLCDNKEKSDNKQSDQHTEKEPQINVAVDNHCIPVKVKFSSNVDPEKYDIKWYFDDGSTSKEQTPEHVYEKPGEYKASLYLKPFKKDELQQRIQSKPIICYGIENPKIYFDKNENLYTFTTVESGDISCQWFIDNKQFNTAVVDYEFKNNGSYPVKLTVSDEHGCTQEITKKLKVEIEHDYYVPNAFNVSSNGVNASFGPVGEDIRSMEYRMLIFDKNGQLIFETDDLDNPWKGINQQTNQPAEQGVYLWKITTKDKYGNTQNKQGQVTLFRN
ncbi:MAG: PKD domain-containing protein [Bacteroidota bacterium]|nr:PKD domain-containing protein [Bacteroidota bacterium]